MKTSLESNTEAVLRPLIYGLLRAVVWGLERLQEAASRRPDAVRVYGEGLRVEDIPLLSNDEVDRILQ